MSAVTAKFGATPLMRASVAADIPVVELLLKHRALVDLPLAAGKK